MTTSPLLAPEAARRQDRHRARLRRLRAGLTELVLVIGVYVGYSLTRLVADESPGPAAGRARDLLDVERSWGLDLETRLNGLFVHHDWLGVAGSFYYATAHYVVTGVVLVWLWRRGPEAYLPARRALVLATAVALVLYVVVPMAPPRLMDGYVDVLQLSSAHGWWGGEASAPRGLGGYTNQLAAFPSMHAGWALWVAWVLHREVRRRPGRLLARPVLGWTHAVITALVIVGTGNHWVLDAVGGWVVVAAAFVAVRPTAVPVPFAPVPGRSSPTSAAGSP